MRSFLPSPGLPVFPYKLQKSRNYPSKPSSTSQNCLRGYIGHLLHLSSHPLRDSFTRPSLQSVLLPRRSRQSSRLRRQERRTLGSRTKVFQTRPLWQLRLWVVAMCLSRHPLTSFNEPCSSFCSTSKFQYHF